MLLYYSALEFHTFRKLLSIDLDRVYVSGLLASKSFTILSAREDIFPMTEIDD